MSLLITITKDFELIPHQPERWQRDGSQEDCQSIFEIGRVGWDICVCRLLDRIILKVFSAEDETSVLRTTEKELYLPLRAGTIVLDDCAQMSDPTKAEVKSFRRPKFQNFLDKYGIFAVRYRDPNSLVLYGDRGSEYGLTTPCVYSDGYFMTDKEDNTYYNFRHASWVLERRVRFDESGGVLDAGMILYTRLKSLKRLETSFAEHGILPV